MPIEIGTVETWSAIEKSIGIVLPRDYKEYIGVFGTGCIGDFLWPLNPFSENKYLNLVKAMDGLLFALRTLKEEFGDSQCPYLLYPEPEGLLPWGITDNGDGLFWLTVGPPDNWVVVINEARAPLYEEYKESMTGFLAKLIEGKIVSEIIPADFLNRNVLFVSRK